MNFSGHKAKEMMHDAKEILTCHDNEKEETETEHVQDENDAKKEKAICQIFSTDQFKEKELPEEAQFSETDKRHAQEAQNLAFVRAQQV